MALPMTARNIQIMNQKIQNILRSHPSVASVLEDNEQRINFSLDPQAWVTEFTPVAPEIGPGPEFLIGNNSNAIEQVAYERYLEWVQEKRQDNSFLLRRY